MQRLNAAYLVFALLAGPALCHAAERVKVEVVQTHTGVTLGASVIEVSDDSDPAWTRCDGTSGIYSKEFGFSCGESSAPPEQVVANENQPGYAFFYDVSVIMPDEAHLVLHCSTVLDPGCAGFPNYPESTSVVCSDFVYAGTAYKDCIATGPSSNGIGVYRAAVHGHRVTIFGSNWQRNYLQYGTWQFREMAAQDQKPALPPEKPDPPQETKPAPASTPAQEPKPALPQDQPGPPQETKPAPAATPAQEPPTAATASPGLSPAAAADQSIDPQIIEQAKAGDAAAQYRLGYDYYLGRGVPVDYVQTAIWWRKAADQGYPEAQNNLGVLYNSGKGVPQSYAEAYFWENLAAARASGPLQSQFAKNRDESASRLWFLARLSVQRRAAKWAAAHPVPPRTAEPKATSP